LDKEYQKTDKGYLSTIQTAHRRQRANASTEPARQNDSRSKSLAFLSLPYGG
jgi:hypothetical protein